MSERSFFRGDRTTTVSEIAKLTGAQLHDNADPMRAIVSIAALDRGGPTDLVFLDHPKFSAQARSTVAGACLVNRRLLELVPAGTAALVVDKPFQAFVAVARALYPEALRPSSLSSAGASAVVAGAMVDPSARLEKGVGIEPGAVIGAGAEIGSGTVIGANAVIGPQVRIGRDCSIGAHTSVAHALIADRVILHPGCRIGQDGFGFVMGARGHQKIPQIGRVIIQDDVEIGANSSIDRGGLRDTVIGEGTKIDNQVQVGHNVMIGRHCVLVSQVGIAGSVVIQDYVVLGGQAGVADNLTIGEGARIAAKAGVMSDVPAGETWIGAPAMPGREFWRAIANFRAAGKPKAARSGSVGSGDPTDE
ncbi:MAG: UDP-3-O-(3-hydroxymyristoyl)glucosamine N-acyltransferase [Hyphomicrobiales bacterium]|nr:UDP-3-O-(3-hydroxymyristoyl)glucosamine N-acyltransferase [Hyphomicrobiales bacterium]